MNAHSGFRWLYPCTLVLALFGWLAITAPYSLPALLAEYWRSAITMMAGSLVAGSTPLGGGAIAFPVFTKLLAIEPQQAKLFSLFIQSVGMTFATLLFISLRIKIMWRTLAWLMPGSVVGLISGLQYISVPGHHIKLLFSLLTLITGILLLKVYRNANPASLPKQIPSWCLLLVGFPAGLLAALIGAGADTLLFFMLVIVFRHKSQQVIPTTVAFMAINSLIGSAIMLLNGEIAISTFVSSSWLVAAPVVAIGAPLGGYLMSKAKPLHLLLFINFIILLEGVSTLVFTPLAMFEGLLLLGLILVAVGYFFRQCRGIFYREFG